MKPVITRTIDAIARQKWLDKPAEALEKAFDETLNRFGEHQQKVRDFLNGVWFEHPLHPGFTDIPVGAWTVAYALDLTGGDRDHPNRGADAAIAIGVLGAVGAAATGLADWRIQKNHRVRRLGLVHAGMNGVAVSLYTASLAMRMVGMRKLGRRASYLGYGVISVSAYLGGHLLATERQGISYAPTDADAPVEFVAVLDDAELKRKPQRVMAGDLAVLLIRSGGEIYAITDECSHLGCSLADGKHAGDTVICPCHGSQFDVTDGSVVRGPAAFPATTLEVRVTGGKIEVRRFGEQSVGPPSP